ncbi:MAG: hypothetical protein QMB40_05895 [Aeromonadaceae bacterium]
MEQEADLVFRRVRVIDESGMVLWIEIEDAKGVRAEDPVAA